MHYTPTHVVSVVTEDDDGVQSTVATGVPVSILRQGTAGQGTDTGRFGDKDTPYTVRAPHGTPVGEGCKLTDGVGWWLVDLAVENHNPVTGIGMVLQCRELTV